MYEREERGRVQRERVAGALKAGPAASQARWVVKRRQLHQSRCMKAYLCVQAWKDALTRQPAVGPIGIPRDASLPDCRPTLLPLVVQLSLNRLQLTTSYHIGRASGSPRWGDVCGVDGASMSVRGGRADAHEWDTELLRDAQSRCLFTRQIIAPKPINSRSIVGSQGGFNAGPWHAIPKLLSYLLDITLMPLSLPSLQLTLTERHFDMSNN